MYVIVCTLFSCHKSDWWSAFVFMHFSTHSFQQKTVMFEHKVSLIVTELKKIHKHSTFRND